MNHEQGHRCRGWRQCTRIHVTFFSGRCPVAHYCPNGSALPIACDPGKFCPREELSEPEFDCEAGYYCTSGASKARPTDNVSGNVCPKGTYCPRGASAPQNCPIGTFLNSTGNRCVLKEHHCFLLSLKMAVRLYVCFLYQVKPVSLLCLVFNMLSEQKCVSDSKCSLTQKNSNVK